MKTFHEISKQYFDYLIGAALEQVSVGWMSLIATVASHYLSSRIHFHFFTVASLCAVTHIGSLPRWFQEFGIGWSTSIWCSCNGKSVSRSPETALYLWSKRISSETSGRWTKRCSSTKRDCRCWQQYDWCVWQLSRRQFEHGCTQLSYSESAIWFCNTRIRPGFYGRWAITGTKARTCVIGSKFIERFCR